MSLTTTLTADAAFRSRAEAKAVRCEPMTDAELASLSTDDLMAYEQRARYRVSRLDTPYPGYDREREWECESYLEIANRASAELDARRAKRIGDGTLKTLSGIGRTLFGGEAA